LRAGWIGVDLDGTLAYYDGWRGKNHIGKPIPRMMEYIKRLIRGNHNVKIFTARVADNDEMPRAAIQRWLRKNGLPDLEITNQKDSAMVQLIDDRCVQVIPNTGIFLEETI